MHIQLLEEYLEILLKLKNILIKVK